MTTGTTGRRMGAIGRGLPVVLALAVACAGEAFGSGIMSANYTMSRDYRTTTSDEGTERAHSSKHTLDLKYRGFLKPVITNEVAVKVDYSVDENGVALTKISPVVTLEYKGSYWNAGTKRTIDESDEPGTNAKVADSYFLEALFAPPRQSLPDLKMKYTLDKDFEKESTDQERHAFTMSSIYKPNEWLNITGNYSRNLAKDFLKEDSDKEEEKYSVVTGIRHFVGRKFRLNSEYKMDLSRSATLLTRGGSDDPKEEQTHTWKNTVSFRPFANTDIDGSYDLDLKQDTFTPGGEHAFAKNAKLTVAQKAGIVDAKGEFSNNITETRHSKSKDDNMKTENGLTLNLNAHFSTLLDFSFRYQTKKTKEEHFQLPALNQTSDTTGYGVSWTGVLTAFWKASASSDRTNTIAKDVLTNVDTKYSLKSTFDFKAVRLILEPSYDLSFMDDRIKPLKTVIRDFKTRVAYDAISTKNAQLKGEHTYARKVDTAMGNIQRADTSSANLTVVSPIPNWNVSFDFTRLGSDTSEDDNPPDVTSSYTLKADCKYRVFTLTTSYKFDRKKIGDDSMMWDAKAGWSTASWSTSLGYSYTKTYSAAVNESSAISFSFQYML